MKQLLTFFVFITLSYSRPINVAVLEFKTKNVKSERIVKALHSEVEKVLRGLEYEIKPKKEVSSIIRKEDIQLDECESSCFYNLGRLMSSDLLIICELSKTGNAYILILKIFKVNARSFHKTITVKSKNGSMKLISKLNEKLSINMADESLIKLDNTFLGGGDEGFSKTQISTKAAKESKNTDNSFLKVITDEQGNLKFDKKKSPIVADETFQNKNNYIGIGTANGALSNGSSPAVFKPSENDLLIETIDLDFTRFQNIESSNLNKDTNYYLKISGTYGFGGWSSPANIDGAYAFKGTSEGTFPLRSWTWNGKDTQRPYPDKFNEKHIYYYYFVGNGTSERFGFEDGGGYGDNNGSLYIELYEMAIQPKSNEMTNKIENTNEEFVSDEKSSFSKLRKHFGFAGKEDLQNPILTFNYDLPIHPIRYEIVDKYSKNIKQNENEPIYTLTDRITKNSNNEFEKVRAIYIWITKNISYDMESYLSNNITSEKVKPINVLKTKKTVCSGYANLFDVMVKHINIPTEVVSGFAKGYGYKPGDIMVNTNHAWNSVKLGGKQYLIDCTWGSGYISDEDKFIPAYREYYFLVDPDFLIWTHLPEKSEFQMINKIITKDEFDILPSVSRPFFENRINFVGNHRVGYIVEDELSLSFEVDENVKLLCKLKDESESNTYEGATYITKQNGNTKIKLRPPSSGNFFLQISSKDDDASSYSRSIEYLITVPENFKKNSGFIKVWYDEIEKYNIEFPEIHSHRYNLSNMLTLEYICPADILLMANIKNSENTEIKNHTFIQKTNNGMQLFVNVPDEKEYTLNIYAKSINEKGNYSGLAEYKLIGDLNDQRKVKTFPKQYVVFNENNGKLSSPLKGILKLKQNYAFLLELDNAIEVSIIHNEKWTKFEKNNLNQFILNKIFETKGKVQVGAKFSAEGSFSIVLEYEIL